MIHNVSHDALVAFLARLVGPDAEDVASETYLAALSAVPHRGESPASTWVYAIAKRQAVNWLRKQGKRQAAEARHTPLAPPTSPDWGVMLAELDEGDRALVDAKLLHGTVAAAARALGLTRGQVRYRWARLQRRVR